MTKKKRNNTIYHSSANPTITTHQQTIDIPTKHRHFNKNTTHLPTRNEKEKRKKKTTQLNKTSTIIKHHYFNKPSPFRKNTAKTKLNKTPSPIQPKHHHHFNNIRKSNPQLKLPLPNYHFFFTHVGT